MPKTKRERLLAVAKDHAGMERYHINMANMHGRAKRNARNQARRLKRVADKRRAEKEKPNED